MCIYTDIYCMYIYRHILYVLYSMYVHEKMKDFATCARNTTGSQMFRVAIIIEHLCSVCPHLKKLFARRLKGTKDDIFRTS